MANLVHFRHEHGEPHFAAAMYALRSSVRNTKKAVHALSRRNMGGHGAPVEYEGVDKIVRGVFPEDWQRELE